MYYAISEAPYLLMKNADNVDYLSIHAIKNKILIYLILPITWTYVITRHTKFRVVLNYLHTGNKLIEIFVSLLITILFEGIHPSIF